MLQLDTSDDEVLFSFAEVSLEEAKKSILYADDEIKYAKEKFHPWRRGAREGRI